MKEINSAMHFYAHIGEMVNYNVHRCRDLDEKERKIMVHHYLQMLPPVCQAELFSLLFKRRALAQQMVNLFDPKASNEDQLKAVQNMLDLLLNEDNVLLDNIDDFFEDQWLQQIKVYEHNYPLPSIA